MSKLYYSFLIFSLTFLEVSAKNVSNHDIFKSISETLDKEKFRTKKTVKIPISYQNNKQNRKFGIKVITPKIDNKLYQRKLEAHKMIEKGYYEIALKQYKNLNKNYPKDNDIKFSLAYVYHKLNRFKVAKKLYYQLINSDYKFKDKVINNILDIITHQSDEDAFFMLKKLTDENDSNPYIISRLSLYYAQKNKLNESILLMKKALYLEPDQISYRLNLAILYDRNNEYENAISIYEKIINDYNRNNIRNKDFSIFDVKNRLELIKKL
jgi:tetratricopeptide (TPR) repeat protein